MMTEWWIDITTPSPRSFTRVKSCKFYFYSHGERKKVLSTLANRRQAPATGGLLSTPQWPVARRWATAGQCVKAMRSLISPPTLGIWDRSAGSQTSPVTKAQLLALCHDVDWPAFPVSSPVEPELSSGLGRKTFPLFCLHLQFPSYLSHRFSLSVQAWIPPWRCNTTRKVSCLWAKRETLLLSKNKSGVVLTRGLQFSKLPKRYLYLDSWA